MHETKRQKLEYAVEFALANIEAERQNVKAAELRLAQARAAHLKADADLIRFDTRALLPLLRDEE